LTGDAIDVVVSALTAGAAVGAKDTATTAVKDAYQTLLTAMSHVFGHARGNQLVEVAEQHADDPESGRTKLSDLLADANVPPGDELTTAAHVLLTAIDPSASSASKYTVHASGAQGVQVGDGNSMIIHF
jgi:hypothetical protein